MLLALAGAALVLMGVPTALAQPSHATATTVTVTEAKPSEFKFTLSTKTFPHGTVTFKITNKSTTIAHDFKVCTAPTTKAADTCTGKGTLPLSPGVTATLKITFAKAGTYEYVCTLPGHATAGMKGLMKVT